MLKLGAACLLRPSTSRAAAVTLVRQPYLQNVQRDRASILWTTSAAGDGGVMISMPDGTTHTASATLRMFPSAVTGMASAFYQYEVDVTGLDPGTQYTYRATQNGAPLGSAGSFRTAAPGRCSFLAFGDSGENTPGQKALIPRMMAEPGVSFLLHTGDLAYPNGSFALYDSNYFGLNAPLFQRLPVFPTPGNHDYLGDSAASYLASHCLPSSGVDPADTGRYYSFDWGDAHFATLDTNLMSSGSQDRMLAWLEDDLASTRQFWKILFLHHPPYPTGHHLADPTCAAVRAIVNPIAERHGVQLVLGGHEHGYERTSPLSADAQVPSGFGTVYVITGGGGADLHDVNSGGLTDIAIETYHYLRVDVDGGTLAIRAIGVDGSEIERYVLQPRPTINHQGVVSIGDYTASLAPGSLVSVFGQNLAVESQGAAGMPLPEQLGGVSVQFDGQEIPLLYVSPDQVNAQIPYEAKAGGTLEVFTANGSSQVTVPLLPTAPSILAVTTRDAVATSVNAPAAGDAVVVYAAGLGLCAQRVTAGQVDTAPDATLAPVEVRLGDLKIPPSFAGLTPGFAGVYQVNFQVPAVVPAGTYPLCIATADASSRAVPLVLR